ncbi:MAG: hypothetical protein ABH875_02345 [Candidatus Omnitrophota bacterium]
MKNSTRSLLLGLGLDCDDDHTRITKGKNFRLYGGSRMTHEKMQEKAIKLNEHLKRRGKALEEISDKELFEIAEKIGLNIMGAETGQDLKNRRL